MSEREFVVINEEAARTAQNMMSFNEYQLGSRTKEYQEDVNEVYDLAEEVVGKCGRQPRDQGGIISVRMHRKGKKMSKRILAAMLSCMLVVGMTGCGFSDGVKDGMKDAQKQESINDSDKNDSKKDKNVTETDKNDTESRENVLESEESETGNPLLDAEVIVCDVMNGTKTEKLGEYAYITVPLETMKKVTMEQYDEFCDQKVQDSGYNWVTIDFGNGSGLQFQGSTPAVATYGTLDNEECIEESKGTVMMTGENTYEHSENQ